jgi:hypothetical protein
MSMVTMWRSGVYHLLPMYHVYIKVGIKFSASECSLYYVLKFPCSNHNGVHVVYCSHAKICQERNVPLRPDGNMHNQIDHILTDRRWLSGILDVCSFRGGDCDTQMGTRIFHWGGDLTLKLYIICFTLKIVL